MLGAPCGRSGSFWTVPAVPVTPEAPDGWTGPACSGDPISADPQSGLALVPHTPGWEAALGPRRIMKRPLRGGVPGLVILQFGSEEGVFTAKKFTFKVRVR